MIKNLLTIALVSAGLTAAAQSFTGVYTFSAVTSGSASTGYTDPTPVPTATGLTFGSFTAVGTGTSTGTNPGANGRFVFDNWPTGSLTGTVSTDTYSLMTGAINTNEYYNVTLTPTSGYDITLTSITFGARRSGAGIRNYAVRSSADSYSMNLPASVGTNTNISVVGSNVFFWNFDATSTSADQTGSAITLSGPSFSNLTSPISFRFYGWNSEVTGGNFSIDNVNIIGSASITTGLGKLSFDLNSNLNVYPVPSHDGSLYIESKNAQDVSKIEVLDILGNVVLTNSAKNEAKIKLNLSDMPNGNYFVRMYSGSSVSTKKIVILK